jgi:hypothetical protein
MGVISCELACHNCLSEVGSLKVLRVALASQAQLALAQDDISEETQIASSGWQHGRGPKLIWRALKCAASLPGMENPQPLANIYTVVMNSGSGQPVRRMKTYTGATGYVYQYYFVGKRAAAPPSTGATEFIFDVTADRKTTFATSVFLKPEALAAWGAEHGRQLTDTEQYAAAKMRLLRAFDEIEHMMEHGRRLVIDGENIQELLEPLGL